MIRCSSISREKLIVIRSQPSDESHCYHPAVIPSVYIFKDSQATTTFPSIHPSLYTSRFQSYLHPLHIDLFAFPVQNAFPNSPRRPRGHCPSWVRYPPKLRLPSFLLRKNTTSPRALPLHPSTLKTPPKPPPNQKKPHSILAIPNPEPKKATHCTSTLDRLPTFQGATETIYATTVTATSSLDCGGCDHLAVSTLNVGPGPVSFSPFLLFPPYFPLRHVLFFLRLVGGRKVVEKGGEDGFGVWGFWGLGVLGF